MSVPLLRIIPPFPLGDSPNRFRATPALSLIGIHASGNTPGGTSARFGWTARLTTIAIRKKATIPRAILFPVIFRLPIVRLGLRNAQKYDARHSPSLQNIFGIRTAIGVESRIVRSQ